MKRVQVGDAIVEFPANMPDAEIAKILAQQFRPKQPEYDPTEGMTTTQKVLAGIGKGMVDVGRGIGQTFGLVSQEDIARARELDAPLMRTGAGQVGNVIGTAATLAPTALIPGANTMAGAALIGAGSGFVAPSVSGEETLKNTLMGGVLGPAALGVGRGVAAGYQGAKALAQPFTKKGQEQIAAKALQSFASDPAAAAARLSSAGQSVVPGVQQTAAEISLDPGIAQLQRTLMNNPDAGRALGQRAMQNTEARLVALNSIAGNEAQRQAAVQAREAAADAMYKAATNATYTVDDQLANLLRRPAVAQAMQRAKTLAENQGRQFAFDTAPAAPFAGVGAPVQSTRQITGQGLQDLKMALDDMLADPASGFVGAQRSTVSNLRSQIVSWMEKANPDFAAARKTYADLSKPINQMDIGRYLVNKLEPPSGAVGERAGLYSQALADPDALAKSATGFKGARFDAMTPDQQRIIFGIRDQLAGVQNAANLGRAAGSNTGQNFVSQNFLRQTLGPTGLPQSWSESALLETLVRPIQFVGKAGEQRVTPLLADAMMNPTEAARLLQLAQRRGLLEQTAPEIARYLPAMGLLGLPAQ